METNELTRQYFDRFVVEQRLIDSVLADTSVELFGKRFTSPIMTPAFSHMKPLGEGRENGLIEYTRAAKELNILNWIGMIENEEFREILDIDTPTVRIIKPYKDKDKIYSQLRYAADNGAFAVGMDIDHIFGMTGYDICMGEVLDKQSLEDIRSYVAYTDLPFIVKGVLSVQDALKCAEAGADAILVSHHHGRMPSAMPPVMILPEIKKALEGTDMKIFVDCGVDTGVDAFKCMCLGADAVCVGRAMRPSLYEGGITGLKEFLSKMNDELRLMMSFTGIADVTQFTPNVLHDINTIILK